MCQAVVLAGGVGGGVGGDVPGGGWPRAMWPFPAQPLISQVLAFLNRAGCEAVAVCANGNTAKLAAQLSADVAFKTVHYAEDPLPRGPAGCLKDLEGWLADGTFIVMQATGWYDFRLDEMLEEHRRSGAAVTVGAKAASERSGMMEPAGVYLVERQALELIPRVGFQDLKEQFLPKVAAAGRGVRAHIIGGESVLIHSAHHYLNAIGSAIARAIEGRNGFNVHGSIAIHETAQVHPSVKITGPAWIDADAEVGENAILSGPLLVGARAQVGFGAILDHCAVLPDGVVPPSAYRQRALVPPSPQRLLHTARRSLAEARGMRPGNPVRRMLSALVGAR